MGHYKVTARRWPGGVIPYTFSGLAAQNQTLIENVEKVARYVNTVLKGHVAMVEKSDSDLNYIKFVWSFRRATCSSHVGMRGGEHRIRCALAAVTDPVNGVSRGTILHEIGHALGLYHEHQRWDRDAFVDVNFSLGRLLDGARRVDYEKKRPPWASSHGPYDCRSRMHYGQQTLDTPPGVVWFKARDGGCPAIGAAKWHFTTGDILTLRHMYPA